MDALSKLQATAAKSVEEVNRQNAIVEPPKEPQATTAPTTPVTTTTEPTAEQIAEWAVKMGYKKEEKTESPEEKAAREKAEKNELLTFSINNLGLAPEVFTTPDLLKEKKDVEILFEDFKRKQLEANPNIKPDTIEKRFKNAYPIDEYPAFEESDTDIDYEDAKKEYEKKKAEYDLERADAIALAKSKAERIRNKAVEPINFAKKEFDTHKKNNQIYLDITSKVDTFVKDFGQSFVYKGDDGDIPIEFPSSESKNQFIEKLKTAAVTQQFNNPSGSVDIQQLADVVLAVEFRKNIDGVLKSTYYNKGIIEGRKNFKNPLTQPESMGIDTSSDEGKKIAQTNKQTANSLKSMRQL